MIWIAACGAALLSLADRLFRDHFGQKLAEAIRAR